MFAPLYRRLLRRAAPDLARRYEDELVAVAASRLEAEPTRLARARRMIAELVDLGRLARRQRHGPAGRRTGMQAFLTDLRRAPRHFRRQPLSLALAIAALALAIAAATTTVSVLYAVVWRPLPFADPDALVLIRSQREGRALAALSAPEFNELRDETTFEAVGGMWETNGTLVVGDEAESIHLAWVTSSFFPALGIDPVLGRHFTAEEDAMRGPRSILISHGLWQRQFGGRDDVLGRIVVLDNQRRTIVGVMPPGLRHYEGNIAIGWSDFDAWIPNADWPNRDMRFLRTVGRLRPDATLAEANGELAALGARWTGGAGASAGRPALVARPLAEELAAAPQTTVVALLGAVGAVLVIACVNAGAILRTRLRGRERELAVHLALGASPGRVGTMVATEAVLCATVAATAGIGIARLATSALVRVGGAGWPRFDEVGLHPAVLLAAAGFSALAAVVFGVGPARQAWRIDPAARLSGGAATPDLGRQRAMNLTIVASVALAVTLLVGAGLMIRTFQSTLAIDTGFDRRDVLTFRASVSGGVLRARAQAAGEQNVLRLAGGFYRDLRDRLTARPGIVAAGASQLLPLGAGQQSGPFSATAADGSTVEDAADYRAILPGYFEALGARLVEGRLLEDADVEAADRRVVIDERLAGRLWPGTTAVGRSIRVATNSDTGELADATIVGVIGHVRAHRLFEPGLPQVYQPYGKYLDRFTDMQFVVRTTGDPMAAAPAVRALFRELAPGLPLANVRPFDAYFADASGSVRFALFAMSSFAALGLVVAIAGLYGLLSYVVAGRRREIGFRLAIGASPRDVVGLVAGQGARLSGTGVVVGLALAWALSRFLTGVLYGVSPLDPLTFAAVALAAFATGVAASLVPAWRAARIDPVRTLRAD